LHMPSNYPPGGGGSGAVPFNAGIDSPTTSLLLHCDTNTFPDTSYVPQTVVVGSGATLDTTDKVFGAGSVALDGTSNGVLSIATNSSGNFSLNDFTVEFFVRMTTSGSLETFVSRNAIGASGTFNSGAWTILTNVSTTDGIVRIYSAEYNSGLTSLLDSGTTAVDDGSFHHVAWTRSGSDTYLYVDGALCGTRSSWSSSIGYLANGQNCIGGDLAFSNRWLTGNIDELRISNGTAWYTPALYPSGFTPPSAPFLNGYEPSLLPASPAAGQLALSSNNIYACVNATGPVWTRTQVSSV
jgi:hypothetical protein